MSAAAPLAARSPAAAAPGLRRVAVIREWKTETLAGVTLSESDRRLAERLGAGGEGRLGFDELREGLRITASSWVGVVRFESLEVRVLPKLEHVDLVRLIEFASGIDELKRPEGDATLDVAGDSLLDWVALLFARATERVLRRGLLSGYVEREEELPVVRGRILADRQLLRRFGRLDRIHCRFDELEHDVDENRLLAAALLAVTRRVETPSVHRRLARLRAVFEPVCDPTQIDLHRPGAGIVYNRLNAHYREAHALARLLLRGLGVDDLLAPGRTRSFAFLLDMNRLFEQFAARLVRRILPASDYRVESQRQHSSIIWDATRGATYARVIPDLLVRPTAPGAGQLPIDAKYKAYDGRHVAPGDIYQCFLYAYAIGQRAGGGPPAALILYPASSEDGSVLKLRVRPQHGGPAAEIRGLGIPIPAALAELRAGNRDGPVCGAVRRVIVGLL